MHPNCKIIRPARSGEPCLDRDGNRSRIVLPEPASAAGHDGGNVEPAGVDGLSSAVLAWRPLTAADIDMLAEWLREPQVARWWNHDTTPDGIERDFGPSVRGEEAGEDLIVSVDGHPIGLVQRSVISDYPEDLAEFAAIVDVPDGAIELDYLIGDAARRGRGLGARMIAAAVENTWTDHPNAPAVLVAVVAANVASWRALEKAGMRRIAEGTMSPDNPIDDPLHYVYRVDRPRH